MIRKDWRLRVSSIKMKEMALLQLQLNSDDVVTVTKVDKKGKKLAESCIVYIFTYFIYYRKTMIIWTSTVKETQTNEFQHHVGHTCIVPTFSK